MLNKTTMKNLILISVFLFAFISCKKEKFPKTNELKGSWTEQTNNSFKHKLFFEEEIMCFFKQTTVDTLIYSLDDNQKLIFLKLKNNPSAGESSHKIYINKDNKELKIFGLFAGTSTIETVFKKE